MAASLRRPSLSSRSSCSPDTDDRGACEDDSIWESYCDECMLDPDCGFCYKMNKSTVIDSSCVPVNKASTNAASWGRSKME
nr:proton myo-inositol cotransporter-like [Equus asinus]